MQPFGCQKGRGTGSSSLVASRDRALPLHHLAHRLKTYLRVKRRVAGLEDILALVKWVITKAQHIPKRSIT